MEHGAPHSVCPGGIFYYGPVSVISCHLYGHRLLWIDLSGQKHGDFIILSKEQVPHPEIFLCSHREPYFEEWNSSSETFQETVEPSEKGPLRTYHFTQNWVDQWCSPIVWWIFWWGICKCWQGASICPACLAVVLLPSLWCPQWWRGR